MEMDSMFKDMFELGGEEFEVRRGESVFRAGGVLNREKSGAKYIGFRPNTDVQPGDWLTGAVSGDQYYVRDVGNIVIRGQVWQIKAYYETEREHEARLVQAVPPPQIVGAIIHEMHGGNIQAIGQAHQSEINQLVSDPEALAEALDAILTKLLEAVKSEMPAAQLFAYMQQAEELKAALKSDTPQPAVIKRLLGTLAFLGDVEGTVGLVTRAWPLIGSLVPIAMTVLQQAQLR